MDQAAVTTCSADPQRQAGLSLRAYRTGVAIIVVATFAFRVALGARGSFFGDDFTFRAAAAENFSVAEAFSNHAGHLNPVGLLLQWLVQHAFPGHYVPLMVLSALLVACAQVFCAIWVADVFGTAWAGLACVAVAGLSPMLLELSTWWSVSLYAAPMVAASWLLVVLASRYFIGSVRGAVVIAVFALCLLTSTKAVLLPLLLLAIGAGLGLGRAKPLGFRGAVRAHWRLWAGLAGLLVVYAVVFAAGGGPAATARPGVGELITFVYGSLTRAALPAVWGGPWRWFAIMFTAAPDPLPWMVAAAAVASVLGVIAILVLRPRTWRLLMGAAAYVVGSAALVALGRAGLVSPVMRYTFDFVLPLVLVLAAGLMSTRWETDARSPSGRRLASWAGWRWVGPLVAAAWIVSLVISYWFPWTVVARNPMKQWVTNARSAYPAVQSGLLRQTVPTAVSVFPMEVGVFLAGDPGRPPTTDFVLDRVLGFDAQGNLIQRDIEGVASLPGQPCQYPATRVQPAVIPLPATVPPASYVVAVDYSLNAATGARIRLGDGPEVPLSLPAGTRRVYAVVDGQGSSVTITVGELSSTLCVGKATVGHLVDGDRVPLPAQ